MGRIGRLRVDLRNWSQSLILESMSSQPPDGPASQPEAESRYERRKRQTRARILTTAAELFGERGVQATKVSEICDQADIAQQTFFNHFPSKGDLLQELSRAGVDLIVATLDTACADGSATGPRLHRFFETLTTAARGMGPMHRELMMAVIDASHEVHGEAPSHRIHEAFERLVRQGIEEGDVTTQHTPEVLVQLATGGLVMHLTDWATGAELDVAERARQMAELLADALARRPDERSTA